VNKGSVSVGVVVGGGLLLGVGLFLLPITRSQAPAEMRAAKEAGVFSLDRYRDSSQKSLSGTIKAREAAFSSALQAGSNLQQRLAAFDSLSSLWKQSGNLLLHAWCSTQAAQLGKNPSLLLEAGRKNLAASRFMQDDGARRFLLAQAISILEPAVQANPNDRQLKVDLASAYVEGTADPMKGITILREVVQADSTFIPAQIQLALFAMQSGQLEKAERRLRSVLTMNPDFLEAYLYLGQALADQGKKTEAVEVLQDYLKRNKEPWMNDQVKTYIEQINPS
jgi:tetratricopeptide (TPR) repeat protein